MTLFKNLKLKEKSEIVICTEKGDYKGRILSVSNDSITMNKVIFLEKNIVVPGFKIFYKENINSVKLSEAKSLEDKQSQSLHLFESHSRDCDHPVSDHSYCIEGVPDDVYDEMKDVLRDIDKLNLEEAIIIEKYDEEYSRCLEVLEQAENIYIEAVFCPTGCHITWMILKAVSGLSFLFHVEKLSENKLFPMGMKEVLESQDSKKITYDCRLLDFFLHCKHNIHLARVLDLKCFNTLLLSHSFQQVALEKINLKTKYFANFKDYNSRRHVSMVNNLPLSCSLSSPLLSLHSLLQRFPRLHSHYKPPTNPPSHKSYSLDQKLKRQTTLNSLVVQSLLLECSALQKLRDACVQGVEEFVVGESRVV